MFDILNVHREDYNVEIVKMRSRYKQVGYMLLYNKNKIYQVIIIVTFPISPRHF